MSKYVVSAVVVAILLTLGASVGSPQIPDEFTNLQVLPKDIGKRELVSVMREFAGSLGVRCNFCHVPGDDPASLEGFDFASDDPEHKQIAREMMQMTVEINQSLLHEKARGQMRVKCVTCHGGVQEPAELKDVLWDAVEEGGVAAAEARYRELRDQYYGMGAYNFGPGTLNTLAEEMVEDEDGIDSAIAMMQLNLEFHPDVAYSHILLGQIYAQKGDTDAAVASIEKALELEPDNGWAKRLLERMKGSD